MKYQKRLNNARERLKGVLRDVSPENADNYDIDYKQIDKYWHNTLGGEIKIREFGKDYPAYGFYLTPKNDPTKSFLIMHLFGSDLRQKLTPDMEEYEGGSPWGDTIEKGLKKLKGEDRAIRNKPSGLESLGIIGILGGLIGIFFMYGGITGNSIVKLSSETSKYFGGVLLSIFLIIIFLFMKNKNFL